MHLDEIISNAKINWNSKDFMKKLDESPDYNDPIYRMQKLNMRNPCSAHEEWILSTLVKKPRQI